MKLLDRYVLRNFAEPFLICFFGFLAIWLVFDLQDNMSEFLQTKASFKVIARFYATQVPQIIMVSLPVGLLLALLFSLSRMSRRNEIVSMLTAGRSIGRVMLPLILVGILASGALAALNYELAPRAEAVRKTALEQISHGRKQDEVEAINGYLFRQRQHGRTWYIRKFRPFQNQFEGVHITQQDPEGKIIKKWYAKRAIYDARRKVWVLNKGIAVDFNDAGDIASIDNFENASRTIQGWTETPARIASANVEARHLTVPELREYLLDNADVPAVQLAPFRTYLQQRFALPLQCLVVVFIGTPLAVAFSRRGVVGGVAAAMILYAALFLTTDFCIALGRGYRLDPVLAAWMPNAGFLLVGLLLLYWRSTNRELPRLLFGRE